MELFPVCSEICLRINTNKLSEQEIENIKEDWKAIFDGSRQGIWIDEVGDLILSGENTMLDENAPDIVGNLEAKYEIYQDESLAEDCQCSDWVSNKINKNSYRKYLIKKNTEKPNSEINKIIEKITAEEI